MTTQEIANRLYELCSQNQFEAAQKELYAPDVTSTESTPQGGRVTVSGQEGLKQKSAQFQSMVEEMHGGYTNEPKVFGNYIFMEMGMDVTMKGMGRMNMTEMCRYEVKDGKIVNEEFYY
ncbi:SnoaL-like domain-containing protein [Chitinophagaceae bacterium MMS25-I14]